MMFPSTIGIYEEGMRDLAVSLQRTPGENPFHPGASMHILEAPIPAERRNDTRDSLPEGAEIGPTRHYA